MEDYQRYNTHSWEAAVGSARFNVGVARERKRRNMCSQGVPKRFSLVSLAFAFKP